MDLSLSTRSEGDRTVVEVGGEIDVYTAPRLREQLVDLVADGKYHLIVDMERVDFLDSTGSACSSADSSGCAPTTARCGWSARRSASSRSSASPA